LSPFFSIACWAMTGISSINLFGGAPLTITRCEEDLIVSSKPASCVRATHGRGQDVAEHGPPGQERLISAEETRHIDCARCIGSSKRLSASVRAGGLVLRDVRERVYRSRGWWVKRQDLFYSPRREW
jgi:hypothetical protein